MSKIIHTALDLIRVPKKIWISLQKLRIDVFSTLIRDLEAFKFPRIVHIHFGGNEKIGSIMNYENPMQLTQFPNFWISVKGSLENDL